jgi:hypothetical protein
MASYFCLSKYHNLFSITNKSQFFKKSFKILSRSALCVKNLSEYFYRKIARHANDQHAVRETRSAVTTDLESQENIIIVNIHSVNMKILKVTLKLPIYNKVVTHKNSQCNSVNSESINDKPVN